MFPLSETTFGGRKHISFQFRKVSVVGFALSTPASGARIPSPIALLNLQHRRRVPLWHMPDRYAGYLFHRLEVDHGHGVRPGVGHVSRLAVGCERYPVGRQSHVSAAQEL